MSSGYRCGEIVFSEKEMRWVVSFCDAFNLLSQRDIALLGRFVELRNLTSAGMEFGVTRGRVRQILWVARRKAIYHMFRLKRGTAKVFPA